MPENELVALLRNRIQCGGPLPFVQFMDTALYHPRAGYYGHSRIGRRGDFYTSTSIGRLFAELLAFEFSTSSDGLSDGSVVIVEAGAHDGQLGADLLRWMQLRRPDLWQNLRYVVLEPHSNWRSVQRHTLEEFADRIEWMNEPADLGVRGVNGVFFSNELLDAFPLHRVGWDARSRSWFEWGVGSKRNEFVWERLGPISPELRAEFDLAGFAFSDDLPAFLPDGFTVEVSPTARRWWASAARALARGRLMTIDYGLSATEYFHPHRASGTLRAYHRHRVVTNLLARPGQQDITAHVNFSALQRAGELEGLQTTGLLLQTRFLTGIAERAWRVDSGFGPWTQSHSRQFQTLTHADHLGRAFKVLVQATPASIEHHEPPQLGLSPRGCVQRSARRAGT